jgi:hypothetical protein
MPVRSTNKMPVRAARAETRGRPPRGINGSGGSSGSIITHKESETSGLAIPSHESHQPRRTRVLKPALNCPNKEIFSGNRETSGTNREAVAGGLP